MEEMKAFLLYCFTDVIQWINLMEEYRVRVFLFKRVVAKSSFFTLAANNYQYGFYAFIYKCIPLPTSINIMSDLFIFVIIQLGFKGIYFIQCFSFLLTILLHLFSTGRYLEVLRRLFEHAFGKLLWPWQSANKTLHTSISYQQAKHICLFLGR